MRKVNVLLSLGMLLFIGRVGFADMCPNPNTTPPEKGGTLRAISLSGVAISDAGQLNYDSNGIDQSSCRGGTAWYDPTSAVGIMPGHVLLNGHIGYPNYHKIIAPDVAGPRSCKILKKDTCTENGTSCVCYCGIFPCVTCSFWVDDFGRLGQMTHAIVPQTTSVVTDDLAVFPTTQMTATITNIGTPSSDIYPSVIKPGRLVTFNGGNSCHQHCTFSQIVGKAILSHNKESYTYTNLELFSGCSNTYGGVQPGDSGSPATTDDALIARVGMVVGGDSTGIDAFVEPISQIRSDIIQNFALPGEIIKIAEKSIPTVSENESDAQYPELAKMKQNADRVISSNSWLTKLKHVDQVTPCWFFDKNLPDNGETGICIEVDSTNNVSEVKRKIPDKIDGVRVRVEPPHVGTN
jgi:hypothetical protein